MRRIPTVRQEGSRGRSPLRPAGSRGHVRARRLSRWALTACLAGVVAFGGTAVWRYDRAEDAHERARRSERRTDAIAAVLAASDAMTRTAEPADGARGTVVVSRSLDEAVLLTSGLASPPSGKAYQLWFDDGGTMRSAGLLDPHHRTAEAVLLEGSVDRASGVGVTVEPAGGSTEPTSAPLALLPFPT